MKAFSLLRDAPWYRREAFNAGLRAAGHEVLNRSPDRFDRNALLVIWNRYGHWHEIANQVEAGGGRVLVAENGYLGKGGTSPKFDVHPGGPKPEHYYALAEGWHNGRGRWYSNGPARFDALEVELKRWRTEGDHILVCPNRSFGVGEQLMHPDWATRTAQRLAKQTKRPVIVRGHPGNNAPKRPLSADLEGAWAVVIWSSGVGVHALAAGIPVFVEAPYWIMKEAAASGLVDDPVMPERRPHFELMAYAQWTLAEIEFGDPFRRLING